MKLTVEETQMLLESLLFVAKEELVPNIKLCRYDPNNCVDLDPVGEATPTGSHPNAKLKNVLTRCLELINGLEGPI